MNPKTNFLSLFSTSFFSFTICIAIGDHRAGNHHSRKASFTSQDEESQAFHPTLEKTTEATKVPGYALQIILEHGEKLSAMIQLRELQNLISQNRSTSVGSSNSNVDIQMSGALWDMIQLVGERAGRNTVLLMDRDSAEVFYIRPEHKFAIQIQRACELPNACVSIIRTCFDYKNENLLWYPPPEGLIELQSYLEALAEVLLEAYSGAVTAKIERGEEHKEFEATYKDSIEGAEELNKEATSHLLSIVKRHGCYKVMCTICCEKCYGNIGIKILVGQFYKWIEYAVRRTMDQTWFAFLQNQRYYFY
ncbi:hypothetical protein P8452_45098 [Trifolium repens]|nr:hypothetical protein P8452_45098 [Trifolium repens]